ncbi:hypothetical protein K457DRAFT_120717 [Linnemannia elongata AG-77]|uniref:Uncharacterized protein n=1 Tax=Linnemannia elongata AG-77 TaxID=1314771 RepID=A0A197KE39_9FUNG|nr:hypothetical protein K457DRAFT_120717 [Linnemannia elongata AG-77]
MIAEALNYYRHDPKGTTPTSIKRWISYTFNLDNFIIEAQFKSALDYGLGVEKIFKCKKSRSRLVLIDRLQQGGQNSDSDDDEEGGDELDGPRGSGSSGRSQTRAGGGQCRTQPQFGTDGAEGDATAAAEDIQDERGQACLNEGDDSQEERQAQGQSGDEYKENDDDETEPDNNRRYGVIAAAKTSFPAGATKMFVAHPKNAAAPKSKKGEGLVKIPKALKSNKVPKSTKATQTTAEEAEAEAEGGLKPGIRKSTKKTVVKETSAASAAKFATSSKAATDAKKEAAKETPVSKNAAAAEKVTVKKKTTLNEVVAPKKPFEYIKLAATQTVAALASALFTNKLAEKSSARVIKKQDKDKDNEAPLHTWVIPSQLFKRKADETVDTEDEELKMKKGTQSLYDKDRRFVSIASGPFKTRGSSGPSNARRV